MKKTKKPEAPKAEPTKSVEFPRASLLATLKKVAPALAAKDIVPILPCFCFDGANVYAFDDSVALVARLTTPFKGGIPGQLFADWLDAGGGKTVAMERDAEGRILVKSGRSKLKLALLPDSDFILDIPELKKALEFELSEPMLEALKKVAISLGTDPGHPWRLGVTVSLEEKKVVFYASDNVTCARASAPSKVTGELVGKSFILPPRFVSLLLERAEAGAVLQFAKYWIAARFSKDLTLYSRALSEIDVATYVSVYADNKALRKKSLEVPKALGGMLTRSLRLLAGMSEASAELKIKDGKLNILTSANSGTGRDFTSLEGTHEDVEARLLPEMVLRALPESERFVVAGGQHLWLFGKSFDYMVSVAEE